MYEKHHKEIRSAVILKKIIHFYIIGFTTLFKNATYHIIQHLCSNKIGLLEVI